MQIWLALHFFSIPSALLIDRFLGEPKRFHPLVGFGIWAQFLAKFFRKTKFNLYIQGLLAWVLAVVPVVIVVAIIEYYLFEHLIILWLFETLTLYLTIGAQSLIEHAKAIEIPLVKNDLLNARVQVGKIVSRNAEKLSFYRVCSAAVESLLENGSDAIFAPIFWFVLLGAPGAVLLRLINTLDAMWGYKTEKFLKFGRVAAKMDDYLMYIPARLTAFTYAINGDTHRAFRCYLAQHKKCLSPNGGAVMPAGAGALGFKIGGPTYYHGKLVDKIYMGEGELVDAHAIKPTILLLKSSINSWICCAFFTIAIILI